MLKQVQIIGIECTSQVYAVQKSLQICIDPKEEQGVVPSESLLTLGVVCFLFSKPSRWSVRLFIGDFSCSLRWACMASVVVSSGCLCAGVSLCSLVCPEASVGAPELT